MPNKIRIFSNESAQSLERNVSKFFYDTGGVHVSDLQILSVSYQAFFDGEKGVFTCCIYLQVSKDFENTFERID